jgi:2-beta-glucuronyltransferase
VPRVSFRRIVYLSAYHDYRTAKRASIHNIARAMARLGHDVSFISMRFSLLSRWKGDSRLALASRANRVEEVDGIKCYLWRTALHPFAVKNLLLNAAMAWLFRLYARTPNKIVDDMLARADDVIIESSVAAIFIRRIKRLNPRANIIYYATDLLDTVGAHPFVRRQLERDADAIGHVSMRSPRMAPDFHWAAGRLFRAEFGVDTSELAEAGANPYSGERNIVSVGSMLFDPGFFEAVAPAFPDVTFHVIGCGRRIEPPGNVRVYEEMPFRDTLAYLKHATAGAAPYHNAPGTEYLADSSLKLAQFEYFGLPSVCPSFAAGDHQSRFGYQVGDADSMRRATDLALAMAGKVTPRSFKSWTEVALRVLSPRDFADTAIA